MKTLLEMTLSYIAEQQQPSVNIPPIPNGYMYLGHGRQSREEPRVHQRFGVQGFDPSGVTNFGFNWGDMNGNSPQYHYICPSSSYDELKDQYDLPTST